MLAAVLSALLLLPVIPPDPIVPPETWIAAGPAEGSSTGTTTASFTFGSDDPSASYRCELDGAVAPCGETYTTPELSLGAHTLSVRAIGENGIDRTPATRNWTVIHVDPEPS